MQNCHRCLETSHSPFNSPARVVSHLKTQAAHQRLCRSPAPATLASQPGPHTLRGAETNFYAHATEQTFDITLLDQHVHITATPATYTWNYGDGTLLGPTPHPGAPLPEERWGEATQTSHIYTQTGDYPATVTTHFRGTYSVNGGPPLPIPGQGDFTSPALPVSVWRAITRNYADNCLQNPHGQGC
ncbi:PKD domain-containing protein [Pseudarthrobacter sp. P1]|uniref:PKD domain-containing protein n=1 Tax=Pseudarthrobacter sp. P1 TaxID=3418418 RepID=UPI003CF28386